MLNYFNNWLNLPEGTITEIRFHWAGFPPNIRLSGIDAKLLQINDLILVKVYRIYTDIYDERIW
jgi:hypothetical protein